jgi:hypothetical protein
MCELAFIEYNLTFDSIMPFPCHNKNFKVIFNNCHLLMTLMIGLHHFFRDVQKCWPRFRVRNNTGVHLKMYPQRVDCERTSRQPAE